MHRCAPQQRARREVSLTAGCSERGRSAVRHDLAVTAGPQERLQNWLTGRIAESQHLTSRETSPLAPSVSPAGRRARATPADAREHLAPRAGGAGLAKGQG